MNHQPPLRVGAVAAVAGALGQAAATVLEPDWSGEPQHAIRTVAGSGIWTLDRLLDLVGLFLAIGALGVVGHTFAGWPGRDWARVGQPFLVLVGALGAGAILAGATLRDLADAWTRAGPAAKPAHLATFDAARSTTDALFFGAFMTLGLYLGTLAAAILAGGPYPRWTGWAAAGSAPLVLGGDLLMLVAEAAFLAVLAGLALFTAVLVALGVTMWRQAARPTTPDPPAHANSPARRHPRAAAPASVDDERRT